MPPSPTRPAPSVADTQPPPVKPPPRGWRERLTVLLPAGLLLGFALLFALVFRDRLLPALPVRVAAAPAIEAAGERADEPAAAGRVLFQASGWIEPDPLPIRATALTDGVIAEVLVLDGEEVSRGQPLARLIDDDARLDRDAARHALEALRFNFEAHCTGSALAMRRIDVIRAAREADAAAAAETEERLERLARAREGAFGELDLLALRRQLERQQAEIRGRDAEIAAIAEELNRIAYETAALAAEIRGAETALARAELALERSTVRSPADGRVLELHAAPGRKVMLAMDGEDSATIATLYQPDRLQLRVDVPLADAARLEIGQRALVRSGLLPDLAFEGEVSRLSGQADLQRNTLQAKVRLLAPDPRLRPEMLCRVEFFAPARPAAGPASSGSVAVHVPAAAIRDGTVWVYDPDDGRVSPRAIETEGPPREGHLRVLSGLRPGERVVLDPPASLRPGRRVRPLPHPDSP